jgi:hypothetical protein
LKTNRLRHLSYALLAGCAAAIATPAHASNEALMGLLKILADKGSITQEEYRMLVEAARSDDKQAQQVAAAGKTGKSAKHENWTDWIKVKGDLRLRYEHKAQDGKPDRDRGRLRYRLGIIAKPWDDIEVGGGLASGSGDPRSTNQTFDDTFSTKSINLDYAYAQWSPTDWFRGTAGKFKRKPWLWQPTDLIWDSDINPEGVATSFRLKNQLGEAFLNPGIWFIEEEPDNEDEAILYYAQLGQHFKSGEVFGTLAGTAYNLDGDPSEFTWAGSGNTTNEFSSMYGLSGELGTMIELFSAPAMVAGFGQYIHNSDTSSSEDTGYALGLKVGSEKLKKPGTWLLKYIYADLDSDAFPDAFPDSDRFDGDTGIKGSEVVAAYAVKTNIIFSLDYYATKQKATGINQDLFQADLQLKF